MKSSFCVTKNTDREKSSVISFCKIILQWLFALT